MIMSKLLLKLRDSNKKRKRVTDDNDSPAKEAFAGGEDDLSESEKDRIVQEELE